ncbi:hypothetical protein DQG23_35145 [Paenibacillus contaminans]|uniref:Uncharacterized protein n=1 Tax=Paenibacillus contaminans TaxID=450362 RepID=A0A329M0G3_9BACL|nr:hypothetical protein DQG23_35145 [Paenibacillus contaminans]
MAFHGFEVMQVDGQHVEYVLLQILLQQLSFAGVPDRSPERRAIRPAFNQTMLKALLYRLKVVRYNLGGILLWLTFSRK